MQIVPVVYLKRRSHAYQSSKGQRHVIVEGVVPWLKAIEKLDNIREASSSIVILPLSGQQVQYQHPVGLKAVDVMTKAPMKQKIMILIDKYSGAPPSNTYNAYYVNSTHAHILSLSLSLKIHTHIHTH